MFLSAGRTQALLRPLLTVGRDETLLMMLERLGAASRTLAFSFVTLGVHIKGFRVIPCKLLCRHL